MKAKVESKEKQLKRDSQKATGVIAKMIEDEVEAKLLPPSSGPTLSESDYKTSSKAFLDFHFSHVSGSGRRITKPLNASNLNVFQVSMCTVSLVE